MTFSQNVQAIAQTGLAPKVVDTVTRKSVLANLLLTNSKKWSGRKVGRAVQVESASRGGSFAGLDTFVTTKADTKRRMEFDVRAYYEPVVIEGLEADVVASDKNAAVDLVVDAMEEAENAMIEDIGAMFYGDGTGNSNKDFLGLRAIVDDGDVVATIGGLSRSTYTTLQAYQADVTGALANFTALKAAESAAKYGSDKVNLHVTTEEKWSEYEALLTPTLTTNVSGDGYHQVTRDSIVAPRQALQGQVGFDALFFRGKPVIADEKCPDDYWFGLNRDHIAWYGLKSSNNNYKPVTIGDNKEIEGSYDKGYKNMGFHFSGLNDSANQYGQVGFFVLLGNLVSFNPNRHFQLKFSA